MSLPGGHVRRDWDRKSVQEVSKHKILDRPKIAVLEGAGSRIRTDDLLITNQLLYQLSYAGIYEGK